MKRILAAFGFFAALNHAPALPNFDSFADAIASGGTAYTAGSGLVSTNTGQTNALGNWISINSDRASNGGPAIVTGSLTYPNLPTSAGNSVSFFPTNGMSGRVGLGLTSTVSVAYYSFLLKVTDLSAV